MTEGQAQNPRVDAAASAIRHGLVNIIGANGAADPTLFERAATHLAVQALAAADRVTPDDHVDHDVVDEMLGAAAPAGTYDSGRGVQIANDTMRTVALRVAELMRDGLDFPVAYERAHEELQSEVAARAASPNLAAARENAAESALRERGL